MNAEQISAFYAERDVRTISYGADEDALRLPIQIAIGTAGSTRAGQVAILAVANMAARTQRQLVIALPDASLLASTLVSADNLGDAVAATLLAINPALLLTINGHRRDDHDVDPDQHRAPLRIGIGTDVVGTDIYIGWADGRGELGHAPVETGSSEFDVVGAATSACLAAAAIFHLSHGRPVHDVQVNLVERKAGRPSHGQDSSPEVGIKSITGPIDAGRIAVIGGGALSHGFAYWAAEFGHVGDWDVVDGDKAELSNSSRCMAMTAADAGWPDGQHIGAARAKAPILGDFLSGDAAQLWYDEWVTTPRPRPDLVLPLANEYGVRAAVAARGEPILLHATTSPNWTAELHRHRPGIDDCPACRIKDTARPTFDCSTGAANPGPENVVGDAALPFLSAAAGLMLLIAVTQLRLDEDLVTGQRNHWRLCFESMVVVQRSVRGANCPHTLPPPVRASVHAAEPRRYDRLDHG
jgi:hypothetical protein